MGVDWLYRASKTFNRALDKREVELRTPTLLTSQIQVESRALCGDVIAGETFCEGEQLLLLVHQERLVAQRDNRIVIEFTNPPNVELERIRTSCVEIGEVRVVNPLSNTVEVSISHE